MNICVNHKVCIENALKVAEKICSDRGIKFTPLRKNILKIIWESHVPIKAYSILEKLQNSNLDRINSAKPITLYRILDLFLDNKIIHKLESGNSFFGCSHPGENHNCYYMICKKCNKLEEWCNNNLLQDINNALDREYFIVDHITLEIFGTCRSCSV